MGLKLIWHSNAAWAASGYGDQTLVNAKRIQKLPEVERLVISAFYGLDGGIVEYEGMLHIAPRSRNWGNDCLQLHSYHTQSDVVISLMDLWVLKKEMGQQGFIFAPWLPIDHDVIPELVLERMRLSYMPITMSKFGYQLALDQNVRNVRYVPHSVETKVYKPHSKAANVEMRKKLGLDSDSYLVGIVAANKGWPSRKAYPQMFEALGEFCRRHKDVQIYCHTLVTPEDQGIDIPTLVKYFGIADRILLPNPYLYLQGFPNKEMSRIYSCMDTLLLTSMGEGFGVPLIEAQACGTPVIVTDFSAMPELVGAGVTVPVAYKWYTPMNCMQALPSIPHIVEALESQYNLSSSQTKEQKKSAREFIVNDYDADYVTEKYWHPIIKELDDLTSTRSLKLSA